MGVFSKLFYTFGNWLRKHIGIEEIPEDYNRLAGLLYERDIISTKDYEAFYGHDETPYERRIRRYMEKYPDATLKQARGHG